MSERRLAVVDCGSNSFRLVVYSWAEGWWKRTDEIHEAVRIGEGLDGTGALQRAPMERALHTLDLYAHYCRATGIEEIAAVATSAIREASNRHEFLAEVREQTGLELRVLSREEEAFYGYLAAVNSTTLADGLALDIGGGSMQLVRVAGRELRQARSWRLGAVVMTERFLGGERQSRKQVEALREHVRRKLSSADWLDGAGERIVGVGGTVRNLAAAAQKADELPEFGVQGVLVTREHLGDLIKRFLDLAPADRASVPGIKPGRADVILAGAVVVDTVLEVCGLAAIEATQAGLREGVFFETLLAGREPPLFEDVRRASVLNLAAQYHPETAHTEHVAGLALRMWDDLAEQGLHDGDAAERELLWAAAMLHDIGVAVDYDDHHKHSRYLVLSAGLAGFSPREVALIAQMVRYHRKGTPQLGELAPLARKHDEAALRRCAALLRVAEQLERSHDQAVESAEVRVRNGTVNLHLRAREDITVACWSARRERDLFERAFGKPLNLVGP